MDIEENVRGWVYVITNAAMPGLVKVGFSLKDPVLRAGELGGTGVPHPYKVRYDALVTNPRKVERRAHEILVGELDRKEWFKCSAAIAIEAIRSAAERKMLLEHESVPADEIKQGLDAVANSRNEWLRAGAYTGNCSRCGTFLKFSIQSSSRMVKCSKCCRDVPIAGFQRVG